MSCHDHDLPCSMLSGDCWQPLATRKSYFRQGRWTRKTKKYAAFIWWPSKDFEWASFAGKIVIHKLNDHEDRQPPPDSLCLSVIPILVPTFTKHLCIQFGNLWLHMVVSTNPVLPSDTCIMVQPPINPYWMPYCWIWSQKSAESNIKAARAVTATKASRSSTVSQRSASGRAAVWEHPRLGKRLGLCFQQRTARGRADPPSVEPGCPVSGGAGEARKMYADWALFQDVWLSDVKLPANNCVYQILSIHYWWFYKPQIVKRKKKKQCSLFSLVINGSQPIILLN